MLSRIFFRSVSTVTPPTYSPSIYDIQESLQEPIPVEKKRDIQKTPVKAPSKESQIHPDLLSRINDPDPVISFARRLPSGTIMLFTREDVSR